jgi:hypothetical protein
MPQTLGLEMTLNQKDFIYDFSHMWKIYPEDKCIHKYKHDHIYVCIKPVEIVLRTGRWVRKNDRGG